MEIAPVTLTGEHVVLEPLAPAHVDGLTEALDPELLRWFPTPATDRAGIEAFVDEALAAQAAGTALPFATVARASSTVVGSTRFGNIDRANRRVEIGWTWIGRRWQRSAINTEAKLLMLTHAFEALGAIRVEFKTDALNEQSRAALARIGAVEEGTFRNHVVTASGRIRDTVWFSLIDREWPTAKQRLLERLGRG